MTDPCIPIEQLARVAALSTDDPERRHLDTCQRCQAMLVLLREFEAGQASRGANPAAADPRLLETIEQLTGVGTRPSADVTRVPRAIPWWQTLIAPRPAWALAALLVVVAGGVLWSRLAGPPRLEMRSAPPAPGVPHTPAWTAHVAREVGGGVELSWDALPGADHYQVVFFDASLREIARLAPTAETRVTLRADALPAGLTHGVTAGWQVDALSAGDRIARSGTQVMRVP